MESVRLFTLHISLLVSQNAGNTHWVISRSACCLSYASDKHWPLRNVHFFNTDLWDTAELHRIMPIAMYDYSLWWRAMTTNKNKLEPSMSLCQDLVDFIPFYEFPWDSRSHHGRLESLVITCTHLCWNYSDSHLWRQGFLLGGERPSTGRWWSQENRSCQDDWDTLPVDCWRPGIWWWDSWCSSRYHCYGWVCRYWCQCCEWAWQY